MYNKYVSGFRLDPNSIRSEKVFAPGLTTLKNHSGKTFSIPIFGVHIPIPSMSFVRMVFPDLMKPQYHFKDEM